MERVGFYFVITCPLTIYLAYKIVCLIIDKEFDWFYVFAFVVSAAILCGCIWRNYHPF